MSYICHPLFFNVRRELIENNPRRINKVIYSSIFFEMFIYLAMVIAGYISLGNNLQVPLFTERPNYENNSGDI
jgi:amino acid permease